jgi:glyoxylase-like metal-dependent hydrolase (beta-lactamase superfamily II)
MFKPDLYIDEGYDFSGYGFDAKVLELPGHSKGSIGTLMTSGDLFCGDLLVNTDKPAARASREYRNIECKSSDTLVAIHRDSSNTLSSSSDTVQRQELAS